MTTQVEFLQNCGNDRAGERKAIDLRRAKRLAWTGYVRILDADETAVADDATEKAIKLGRRERRG